MKRMLAWMVLLCVGAPGLAQDQVPVGKQVPKHFEKEISGKGKVELNYLLYLPKGYDKGGKDWPLMLFLHGAGETGSDVEMVKKHGPPKLLAAGKDLPFIVVSPQAPKRGWVPQTLNGLLDEVIGTYKVDKDRVYLTGLSMGGAGTWSLAASQPDRFAAIVPICGPCNPKDAVIIKDLPIRIFHGGKDPTVNVKQSEAMFKALKDAGAKDVELKIYPEAGHDSWTVTYNNPAIFDWLLTHKRVAGAVAPAQPAKAAAVAPAQPGKGKGGKGPAVVSPEVKADRSVTFRINAPKAQAASINSSDIPGKFQPRAMKKGDNGVWEVTLGPLDPGTFRYQINVDGVVATDSKNQAISESNGTVWSVVHVPGADFMDTKNVPHGAVAQVYYDSPTLGRTRRMHVYTPPGYELGNEKVPVFYLLHGAGDSDNSWTSVGRANFILDNLIAAQKAKPMIVVMPAGHTGPFAFGGGGKGGGLGNAKFEDEFQKDIMPYIEKHYRVLTDRPNRALAGLSMGGAQTLAITAARPKDFGYVGVYSSGLIFGKTSDWEKEFQGGLGDAEAKKGMKLLWFATGTDDFLMPRTRETVDLFKKNGYNPVFRETTGGHTWINWQLYLNEFAPKLFR
jgi:predicted peptidase